MDEPIYINVPTGHVTCPCGYSAHVSIHGAIGLHGVPCPDCGAVLVNDEELEQLKNAFEWMKALDKEELQRPEK